MWRYGEEPAPCPRQLHRGHPLAPHHPPPRPDTPLVLVPAHFSEADVEAQRGQATRLASHSNPRRGLGCLVSRPGLPPPAPQARAAHVLLTNPTPGALGGGQAQPASQPSHSTRAGATATGKPAGTEAGAPTDICTRWREQMLRGSLGCTGPGSGGVPCGASWAAERIWGRGQTSHSTSRTRLHKDATPDLSEAPRMSPLG